MVRIHPPQQRQKTTTSTKPKSGYSDTTRGTPREPSSGMLQGTKQPKKINSGTRGTARATRATVPAGHPRGQPCSSESVETKDTCGDVFPDLTVGLRRAVRLKSKPATPCLCELYQRKPCSSVAERRVANSCVDGASPSTATNNNTTT